MSSDLDTKAPPDSDIDDVEKIIGKLSGNFSAYVLTINTKEDLELLRNKTFITNYDTEPYRWTYFYKDDVEPSEFNFGRWKGTQVIFVGDIAESAGFVIEEFE